MNYSVINLRTFIFGINRWFLYIYYIYIYSPKEKLLIPNEEVSFERKLIEYENLNKKYH